MVTVIQQLLATARTIVGQSFDGSVNITIASTDLSNTSNIGLVDATQTFTNKTLTSFNVTGLQVRDSSIVFEGSTDDGWNNLQVTDPTADRTITLQNGSGTLAS